jgi:hypothetical protein
VFSIGCAVATAGRERYTDEIAQSVGRRLNECIEIITRSIFICKETTHDTQVATEQVKKADGDQNATKLKCDVWRKQRKLQNPISEVDFRLAIFPMEAWPLGRLMAKT